MKPYIVKEKEFIKLFNSVKPCLKQQVIRLMHKPQILCVSEICKNFLKGNLGRDSKVIRKLKKSKKDIQLLALKSISLDKKKKILNNKSGGTILSILLPIAASLVSSLISATK